MKKQITVEEMQKRSVKARIKNAGGRKAYREKMSQQAKAYHAKQKEKQAEENSG